MVDPVLLEREDLITELTDRLNAARDASGSLVLLAGEAGSGKTSLVRAYIEVAGQRALTLFGACDPLSTPRPLSPLIDFATDDESGLDGLFDDDPDNIEIFNRVLDRIRHTIRPIIMIVEDIHWADQATLDFLRFIGRRIGDSKAVVVGTYRDDEIDPDHPLRPILGQLSPLTSTHRLIVPPLTEEAVGVLAENSPFDPGDLHRITGGNAFYVTEVIAGDQTLPSSVQDAVIARVARLERRSREVVEGVSIAPRSLGVEQAKHLVGATVSQVDAAVGSGVILGDGRHLRFRHELARSAVEESIPPARRFALHRRMIALLLEGDSRDHARLAHHAVEADEPELIVEYAPMAARTAAERGAHKEAVAFLEAALVHSEMLEREDEMALRLHLGTELGIVDRQTDALEQISRVVDYYRDEKSHTDLGSALVSLSNALWRTSDTKNAEAAMEEALAILEPLGPSRGLANALYRSGYEHMLARRAGDARAHLDRALEMANDLGIDDLLWSIEMIKGTIEIVLGNVEDAVTMLKKSTEDAKRSGDREGVAIALGMLGSGGGEARVYREAIPALEESIRWGLENDQDYKVAYSRSWLARIAFEQGRWDDAIEMADLVDRTSANRVGIAIVTSQGAKGRVLVRRGEPGGRELLEEAIGLGKRHELQHIWSPICGLSEHYWLTGKPEKMRATLGDAHARALRTDSEWARGEVGYWMWKAGAIRKPPQNAAEPFARQMSGEWERAAEIWREIGCPYEVGLALSEGDEAAMLESLSIFDSLGARPVSSFVRSRLRGLGVESIPRGPTKETASNPAGLTNRQLEVLELVSDGLSNAEIAEQLFISKKTVEHHISAIYSKLHVTSRAKAVVEASRLGIVRTR